MNTLLPDRWTSGSFFTYILGVQWPVKLMSLGRNCPRFVCRQYWLLFVVLYLSSAGASCLSQHPCISLPYLPPPSCKCGSCVNDSRTLKVPSLNYTTGATIQQVYVAFTIRKGMFNPPCCLLERWAVAWCLICWHWRHLVVNSRDHTHTGYMYIFLQQGDKMEELRPEE